MFGFGILGFQSYDSSLQVIRIRQSSSRETTLDQTLQREAFRGRGAQETTPPQSDSGNRRESSVVVSELSCYVLSEPGSIAWIEPHGSIESSRAEKMWKPEGQGGLGFKEFNDFNLAMLAKQSWHMLKNRTALWDREPHPLMENGYGPTPGTEWLPSGNPTTGYENGREPNQETLPLPGSGSSLGTHIYPATSASSCGGPPLIALPPTSTYTTGSVHGNLLEHLGEPQRPGLQTMLTNNSPSQRENHDTTLWARNKNPNQPTSKGLVTSHHSNPYHSTRHHPTHIRHAVNLLPQIAENLIYYNRSFHKESRTAGFRVIVYNSDRTTTNEKVDKNMKIPNSDIRHRIEDPSLKIDDFLIRLAERAITASNRREAEKWKKKLKIYETPEPPPPPIRIWVRHDRHGRTSSSDRLIRAPPHPFQPSNRRFIPDGGEEELLGGYESDTIPPLPFRVSTRSSHASASVGVTVGRDAHFSPSTSTLDVLIDEEVETTGSVGIEDRGQIATSVIPSFGGHISHYLWEFGRDYRNINDFKFYPCPISRSNSSRVVGELDGRHFHRVMIFLGDGALAWSYHELDKATCAKCKGMTGCVSIVQSWIHDLWSEIEVPDSAFRGVLRFATTAEYYDPTPVVRQFGYEQMILGLIPAPVGQLAYRVLDHMHLYLFGLMRHEYDSDAEYLEAVKQLCCSIPDMYIGFRHQRPYR
uniref:Putative reverse transcriptase n=1 Tax=Linum usitatissimum TaxID=4006 RepID=G8GJ81_LINUS|nr:putative reverse transcriptase [Linum usitatissimum]